MKKWFLGILVFSFLLVIGCQLELSQERIAVLIENNQTKGLNWWVCFTGDKKVFGIAEEKMITKAYFLNDFCQNNLTGFEDSKDLIKFSCRQGLPKAEKHYCISGCQQASCIAFSSCNDSDRGRDFYTAGKITMTDQFGKKDLLEDVCLGNELTELSCFSAKEIAVEEKYCLWGCTQGRCLKGRMWASNKSARLIIPKKLVLEAVPDLAAVGQQITVTVRAEGMKIKDPQVIARSSRWQLYDDGFHGDGKAQDNLFATSLTFSESGKYNLSVVYSTQGRTEELKDLASVLITAPVSGSCQIFKPAKTEKKIDVVIATVGYENESSAIEKIIDFSGTEQGLFSIEPFKSNRDLFQIWQIHYSSISESPPSNRLTTFQKGYQLLSICPKQVNLFIHQDKLLAAREESGQAKSNYGFSYYDPNRPKTKAIILHEFFHALAGLRDEYEKDSIGTLYQSEQCYYSPQVACQENVSGQKFYCQETKDSYQDCLVNSSWSVLIGRGCGNPQIIDCNPTDENYSLEINCYLGCGRNKNLYRSTYSSGMRKVDLPLRLGPVNEKIVCQRIKELTGVRKGKCLEYD